MQFISIWLFNNILFSSSSSILHFWYTSNVVYHRHKTLSTLVKKITLIWLACSKQPAHLQHCATLRYISVLNNNNNNNRIFPFYRSQRKQTLRKCPLHARISILNKRRSPLSNRSSCNPRSRYRYDCYIGVILVSRSRCRVLVTTPVNAVDGKKNDWR